MEYTVPMCKNRVCLPEFSTYIFKSSSVAMGKETVTRVFKGKRQWEEDQERKRNNRKTGNRL